MITPVEEDCLLTLVAAALLAIVVWGLFGPRLDKSANTAITGPGEAGVFLLTDPSIRDLVPEQRIAGNRIVTGYSTMEADYDRLEIARVIDNFKLIDAESYERRYWRRDDTPLPPGYYVAAWPPHIKIRRFNEYATF